MIRLQETLRYDHFPEDILFVTSWFTNDEDKDKAVTFNNQLYTWELASRFRNLQTSGKLCKISC